MAKGGVLMPYVHIHLDRIINKFLKKSAFFGEILQKPVNCKVLAVCDSAFCLYFQKNKGTSRDSKNG